MGNEQKNTRLIGGILGFLASFGGVGSLVTAFHFDGVSMTAVALTCAATAVLFAAALRFRFFPVVPGVLALAAWGLWRRGPLNISLEALVGHMSHLYDMGYGWGVIRWSEEYIHVDMSQLALCAVGVVIALGVCWSFIRGKGIWPAAAVTFLPVVPCMILTDTVPGAMYLFLQFLCLALLLMVRIARKGGHGPANVLLKRLALPVAAALGLLFVCMPQDTYTSLEAVDAVIGHVQAFFTDGSKKTPNTPVRQESDWVNLASVGPKGQRKELVMEVTAQTSGYLYLRGVAYDAYHGTWWDCEGTAVHQPQFSGRIWKVQVTTSAVHDNLYLPYGTFGISNISIGVLGEEKGRVRNASSWHSYTVQYTDLPAYQESWQIPAETVPQQFTQLPRDTLAQAKAYLARELPELETMDGVWSKADRIADHVAASAEYSLQTPKMPGDAEDFAMWFLEESDSGYCIHFASAATVLLRAAGIPARYVTGYLVDTQAAEKVKVRQSSAHAWVECYIDGMGWVPLEATPAGGVTQTAQPEATQASTETMLPEMTTGATEPETTGPEQTLESSGTTVPQIPPTTSGGNNGPIGGADGPQTVTGEFPQWLRGVLFSLAALAALTGQWRLRVWLRRKRRGRGGRNAQALARWREAALYARVWKEPPEDWVLALAQKAKFSHHTVTREELNELDSWLRGATEKTRLMHIWQRCLATVIYALY